MSGGEGELGVYGGSNGQKNITFDLSIGGGRSRRAELIQVDVYVVDKHSGKCGRGGYLSGRCEKEAMMQRHQSLNLTWNLSGVNMADQLPW